MSPNKVLLIVPCYNEGKRLDIKAFKDKPGFVTICFANDGSSDNTKEVLSQLSLGNIILNFDVNEGKACAIWKAYRNLRENQKLDDFKWLGYWDADLATPFSELDYMLTYGLAINPNVDVILGSRVQLTGLKIERKLARHYLGRIFATLTNILFGLGFYDTQCGSKIFKIKDGRIEAFEEKFKTHWIFDVELLSRIKGDAVEVPLRQWRDVSGSKLKFFPTLFSVLRDYARLLVSIR